jgi:hypothetical protein
MRAKGEVTPERDQSEAPPESTRSPTSEVPAKHLSDNLPEDCRKSLREGTKHAYY